MTRISGISSSLDDSAFSAGTEKGLLRYRANALRALEEAESTDDRSAAADARKQVQEAQRLIQRYGFD
jgi:hypothetical protein